MTAIDAVDETDRANSTGSFSLWRLLLLAQLREQPMRFLVTVLALALGVALGSSVYLVNTSALNEFGLATDVSGADPRASALFRQASWYRLRGARTENARQGFPDPLTGLPGRAPAIDS